MSAVRSFWAWTGEGSLSMTVKRTDALRGNHCEKMAVSRLRVSFDRKSRGRILMFNVLTIFSTFSRSLR